MGIYSRDYIRDGDRGGYGVYTSGYGGSLWAIKYLLIANVVVFALDSLLEVPVNDWLALKLNHRIASSGAEVYNRVPDDGSRLPEGHPSDGRIEGGTVVSAVQELGPYVGIRWGDRHQNAGWVEAESVHRNRLAFAEVWRYVTYGFCHDHQNLMHILFNMYFLWMFGRLVEPIYGSREFLAFYLSAVVISGMCFLGVQSMGRSDAGLVGASGAVMAVVFLAAMHYPRQKVLLMLFIPIEFRWLAVLYAVADTFGFLRGGTNIAHIAHLGGAAFGVAYKYYGWQMLGIWSRLRLKGFRLPRFRSRPKVRIYKPSAGDRQSSGGDLDAQVDRILDKINQQGEASLTDQERDLLKQASRKYKER